MRIYNFPTLYPGELFYGTIGSYKFRHGINRSSVGDALFNKSRQEISFVCVKNLQTICNQLGPNFAPDEIIRDHSLLYVYYPFLDKEKQQQLLNNILSEDLEGKCCIVLDELNLEKERFIQYCPECAKEDVVIYGEPYIHREHQVPKIRTCYKHGGKLLPYPFDYNEFGDLCKFDYSMMETESEQDTELVWKIAKDTVEFINLHKSCSREEIVEKYMTIYFEAGYLHDGDQVDRYSLVKDYLEFYSEEFVQQYTDISLLDKSKFSILTDWVCSLKSQSLLQHILLLNYFGISVSQFYDVNEGLILSEILPNRIKDKKGERSDDEKILDQLKRYYRNRIEKAYKYKELMPDTMFRGIGIKHWREIIKGLPLSRKYLSGICQTLEEASLRYCKDLINEHIEQNGDPLTLPQIKLKFAGSSIKKLEDFHQIENEVDSYLKTVNRKEKEK